MRGSWFAIAFRVLPGFIWDGIEVSYDVALHQLPPVDEEMLKHVCRRSGVDKPCRPASVLCRFHGPTGITL